MTTNTTPSGEDALLQLIESYVEKRHTHGAPQYNVVTALARDAVLAALSAAQDAPAEEVEALNDMLSDARLQLDMLREALGVKIEPHQSLFERMMDAARGAQKADDALDAPVQAAPQPAAPVHPRDDAVFELWWADHMPNASQADAWAEWCSLRANQPEPRPAAQAPAADADALDAARYRKLRAMATQQADSLGPIFRIDVRRSAPYLFNFDAAIDAAIAKAEGTTP